MDLRFVQIGITPLNVGLLSQKGDFHVKIKLYCPMYGMLYLHPAFLGELDMIRENLNKQGFTLVEVLVVVAIIGILSGVGFANLQGAVANARIKDATFNTKAYLGTVAQEAKRLNTTLCVKVTSATQLKAYKGDCEKSAKFEDLDLNLTIESPNKFIASACPSGVSSNWSVSSSKGATFAPKIGLSAVPQSGCVKIQYGSSDLYGSVVKQSSKNYFESVISHDDQTWSGI